MSNFLINPFVFDSATIPTPQAGVCTVYPIAIPVTSGLVHYSSPFNFCNHFSDVAGTTVISPIVPQRWFNCSDLSGNSNPQIAFDALSQRRLRYDDLGSGEVNWLAGILGGSVTFTEMNNLFRLGDTVKTVLCLANPLTIDPLDSSGVGKCMGFHGNSGTETFFAIRLGTLQMFDGAWRDSGVIPTSNQWAVYSSRTDANIKLGVDKSYAQAKATAIRLPAGEFCFGSPKGVFGYNWDGTLRDLAIYDRELSDAEVDTMVDYMKAKWNL